MVVVVIIAVLATFFVGSISSNPDRTARLESQRFMAVVNEVRDEAIIAGELFLLAVDEKEGRYAFNSPRADRSIAQDSGLFKPRSIKPSVKLSWQVFEQFDDDQDTESGAPQVLISPLGEITPFELRFSGEQIDYKVFVNEDNQLQLDNQQGGFN